MMAFASLHPLSKGWRSKFDIHTWCFWIGRPRTSMPSVFDPTARSPGHTRPIWHPVDTVYLHGHFGLDRCPNACIHSSLLCSPDPVGFSFDAFSSFSSWCSAIILDRLTRWGVSSVSVRLPIRHMLVHGVPVWVPLGFSP